MNWCEQNDNNNSKKVLNDEITFKYNTRGTSKTFDKKNKKNNRSRNYTIPSFDSGEARSLTNFIASHTTPQDSGTPIINFGSNIDVVAKCQGCCIQNIYSAVRSLGTGTPF